MDVIGYLESHSVQEYTQEIAKDIQLTAQQLDWDAVDRLVDDLIYYKKVFALGMMFSGTAAMDLQIKLGRCGKFIVAPRNDIQQMDNVARADEDTLLIVFSDSGQYLTGAEVAAFKPTNIQIFHDGAWHPVAAFYGAVCAPVDDYLQEVGA